MVQYYLRHYFNPDFDYLNLKPGGDSGATDVYSLGYVQNVIAGQVLAEILPLEAVEREAILAALEVTGGNKTEAAKQLGITRKTLLAKLQR